MTAAMALVWFLVVTLSTTVVSSVFAANPEQGDAKTWLSEAKQSMSDLNYQGMVTYLKDQKLESLKIFHSTTNGVERERLLSVNTPMREIVRNSDTVTCFFPDSQSMIVENRPSRQSYLLALPADLSGISKFYAFTLLGTQVVAQRQTRIIFIQPLDDFRYGRKIWIDVESKLPLKYELMDDSNQVIEEMVFNELNVKDSISEHDLAASTQVNDSWKVKHHEPLSAESLKWTLNSVPGGFRMVSYTRLKHGSDQRVIDHILLSDGFSSISIYIDQLMNEIFTAQPKKVGAVNAYTRKLDDYLITVMGEVPSKTVQVIADGIRQQGQVSP